MQSAPLSGDGPCPGTESEHHTGLLEAEHTGLPEAEQARARLFMAACRHRWEALPGTAIRITHKHTGNPCAQSLNAQAVRTHRRACARVQRRRRHASADSRLPGARHRVRARAARRHCVLPASLRRAARGPGPHQSSARRRAGRAVAQAAVKRLRAAQVRSARVTPALIAPGLCAVRRPACAGAPRVIASGARCREQRRGAGPRRDRGGQCS